MVKRLIRILFGVSICLIPMLLATYIWLFHDDDGETWVNTVGKYTWYLASGQWDKLPE